MQERKSSIITATPTEVYEITETARTIFTNAATQIALNYGDQSIPVTAKGNLPAVSEATARAAYNLAQDFKRMSDNFRTEYMNDIAKKDAEE